MDNFLGPMLKNWAGKKLVPIEYHREDCLKITSSCHWWWISGRPRWEPEFMKLGAKKAIEIIRQHGSSEEIATAEKTYKELKELH